MAGFRLYREAKRHVFLLRLDTWTRGRLKSEFAIYAVRSGRINVADITVDNIDYLCESIVKVL